MSIFSEVKIAMHNIMQNKLRSFLTVAVLFVLSVVLLFVSYFAVFTITSCETAFSQEFEQSGVTISVYNQITSGSAYPSGQIYEDDLTEFFDLYNEENSVISMLSFDMGGQQDYYDYWYSQYTFDLYPAYLECNLFDGATDYLIEGRLWNSGDAGKYYCWLDDSFSSKFSLGDSFVFYDMSFTIKGFLDYSKATVRAYGTTYSTCYIDYDTFIEIQSKTNSYINQVNLTLAKSGDGEYLNSTLNRGVEIINDYGEVAWGALTGTGLMLYSESLETYQLMQLIKMVVYVLVGFISIILILLSIGTVSNTITISIEQNNKFFGLLKAIGLKNKSIRNITWWQVGIMTFVSVVLAMFAMFLLSPLVEMLASVIVSLAGLTLYVSGFPYYLVFVIFATLLLSVIIATNINIKDFNKKDVIAVINEVK